MVCVLGLLQVNPGYWAKVSPSGFVSTLQCAQNRCPGTGTAIALSMSASGNLTIQQCDSTRVSNSDNFMCGFCAGANYQDIQGTCVECSETNAGLVVLLLVICAVFIAIIYALSKGNEDGTTSVVLYYTQIALLIAGPTASWTTWTSAFALSPSNSNYFSSCIFKMGECCDVHTYYLPCFCPVSVALSCFGRIFSCFGRILFSMRVFFVFLLYDTELSCLIFYNAGDVAQNLMMPLIITIIVYAVGLCISLAIFLLSRVTSRVTFDWNLHVRTALAIAMFVYTSLTQMAFSALMCVDVGGQAMVYAYPTISCSAPEYRTALAFVCLIIVFFIVGLPALTLYTTWLAHAHKKLPERFRVRWGLAFEPYNEQAYYYQSVVLMRRAVYSALDIGLSLSPFAQRMMISLCALACLITHQHVLPFKDKVLNSVETASLILHVALSIVVAPWVKPYPLAIEAFICVLVVLPTLTFTSWRGFLWFKQPSASKAAIGGAGGGDASVDANTGNIELGVVSAGKGDEDDDGRGHAAKAAASSFASNPSFNRGENTSRESSPAFDGAELVYTSKGTSFAPGSGRFHIRNKSSVVLDGDAAAEVLAALANSRKEGAGPARARPTLTASASMRQSSRLPGEVYDSERFDTESVQVVV